MIQKTALFRIDDKTHYKAKIEAAKQKISLKTYIESLVLENLRKIEAEKEGK